MGEEDKIIKKRKGDHDNKPRNYTRHLFGLLGREQDLMIPFRQIRLIGTDTILVVREAEHGSTDSTKCTISKRFHIEDLFK